MQSKIFPSNRSAYSRQKMVYGLSGNYNARGSLESLRNAIERPSILQKAYKSQFGQPDEVFFTPRHSKIHDSNKKMVENNRLLTNRIQTLENEKYKLKDMDLDYETRNLTPLNNHLQSKVMELDQSNLNLQNESKLIEKKIHFRKIESNQIENEIAKICNKIDDITLINNELATNFEQISTKFDEDNETLDQNIKQLKDELLKLTELQNSLVEINEKLRKTKEANNYNDNLIKMRQTIDFLATKNETSKKVEIISSNLEDLKKLSLEGDNKINELLEQKDKLEEEVEKSTQAIQEKKAEKITRDKILQELNNIKITISDYAKKIDELYQDIEEKNQIIKSFEDKYEELNNRLEGKGTSDKRKVPKNSQPKGVTEEQYLNIKKKNTELKDSFEKLKEVTEEIYASGKNMKVEYDAQIEKLNKQLEEKKKQFIGEDKDFEKLLSENEELRKEHEKLMAKLDEVPKLGEDLKKNIDMYNTLSLMATELSKGLNLEGFEQENQEEN